MRKSGDEAHRKLLFFIFGWLGMVLFFTQRWILGPVIPALIADFGVDKTALGVVGSATMWGYMVTGILSGLLSDRFGRKYVILTGIFGSAFLTLICGLVNSMGQLFAARFIAGMTDGFFFVPLMAFTLELFPERPGFYLALMSSGSSLGWFTGPALAGWLVNLTGSWRLPFQITGLIGLGVAVCLLASWPDRGSTVRSGLFFDRSIRLSNHLIMLLLLGLVVAFDIGAEFGFTMWLPAFLELEARVNPAAGGLIAGTWGLGQFLGRPVLGWVSDRFTYRPIGIAGALLLGVSLLLVLGVDNPRLRALFTFQAGFIGAALMGTIWTFTGLLFPSFKGLALGIVTTLGAVVGSPTLALMGAIGDHYSVGTALRSVSVPCAFMAGLCLLATFLVRPSLLRKA